MSGHRSRRTAPWDPPSVSQTPLAAVCGRVLECSRPEGHRGHHGGWRPVLDARPVPHLVGEVLGAPLSAREIETLREYARLGDQAAVAYSENVSIQTVKNTLSHLYAKLGATGVLEALTTLGWLTIPDQTQVAAYDAASDYAGLRADLEGMRLRAVAMAEGLSLALADRADEPPPT